MLYTPPPPPPPFPSTAFYSSKNLKDKKNSLTHVNQMINLLAVIHRLSDWLTD